MKRAIAIVLGSIVLPACGEMDPYGLGSEAVATSVGPLYLTGAKWPNGVVPMCWDIGTMSRPNFAAEAATIRNYMNNSWPTVANVEFVGWTACQNNFEPGKVRVVIATGTSNHVRPFVGYNPGSMSTMTIDPTDARGPGVTVTHEAGHVLGFNHEFTRPDFGTQTAFDDAGNTFPCEQADTITGGNKLDTPPDPQSQLASTYCGDRTELSMWDAVGAINAYGPRTTALRPIITAWSGARLDNVMVSTAAGIADVKSAGSYGWYYAHGWVLNRAASGTVPLKLYWNGARSDNVTLASSTTEQEATNAGYGLMRIEGYVFSSQQPGTVPLKQYFSDSRLDYMLATPGPSEQAAIDAGYRFLRTEGYIPATTPFSLLWRYSKVRLSPLSVDTVTTGQNSKLATDLSAAGYSFLGFEAAVWKFQYPGTTLLKNYLKGSSPRDHFALATSASQSTATSSGYALVGDEYAGSPGGRQAFVYTSPACTSGFCNPWTQSLKSYRSSSFSDYTTTVSAPTSGGYQEVRTEGHVIPIIQ